MSRSTNALTNKHQKQPKEFFRSIYIILVNRMLLTIFTYHQNLKLNY